MALIDNDQLKKFKEALEAIIVSSQGLTYDACKDVAEREATFLISMLLQEPNIQSSNIKETIRKEIERRREYGKFQYDHIAVGLTPAHYFKGVVDTLEEVLDFLDTLPEQPVTDCHELENHTIMEEIRKCGCNPNEFDVARHFFELGLNARMEKSK